MCEFLYNYMIKLYLVPFVSVSFSVMFRSSIIHKQTINKNMKHLLTFILLSLFFFSSYLYAEQEKETDQLYRALITSVSNADFKLMASTYHPDAVLVSSSKTSPIKSALIRWKKDGLAHKNSGGKATLEFRFSKRLINENTAHESGIYRYRTISNKGEEKAFLVHFEDVHIKKAGQWFTLIEHQKKSASKSEWDALASWH